VTVPDTDNNREPLNMIYMLLNNTIKLNAFCSFSGNVVKHMYSGIIYSFV